MDRLSITAIGRDRPGIVAAVTKVLFEQGCNLADCSMTMLGEQFAMIMLLEAPAGLTAEKLGEALRQVESALGLSIDVHAAPPGTTPPPARPYVLSVYGADHPGIVYRVTAELAARRVNITDLMSRIVGDDLYTVVLDVDLPDDLDAGALERDLKAIADEVGLDLTFRQAEIDEL
jgi:glycine cleavage system transcriptional repressor